MEEAVDTRAVKPRIAQILEDFEFVDDWEERYRYVIELGRGLEPLDERWRTPEYKVQGCVSQVWLVSDTDRSDPDRPILRFIGDSDAHIVRGLIAILFAIYSDRPAQDILATDATPILDRIGLNQHLTPQRSNGLAAMVKRIRSDAAEALAGVPVAS